MHLFAIAVAVAVVVGVAALPRVAEPRVEVTVVEGAADGGRLVAVVGGGWGWFASDVPELKRLMFCL